MADLRYYIGPWVKSEEIWSPPTGTVGLVDLGNNSQVAQSTGDSRNIGFFCQDPAFAALAADWTLLGRGDCREIAWTASMRDSWYAMTGVRPSVAANTWLVDALYSHLTTHADDAGDATCPPLMPTIGRELELHLGGHSRVKHEVFDLAESRHGPTLARIKRDLRQMRADAKAGRMGRVTGRGASRRFEVDEDFHRRVLTALCEKLRIDPSSDDWEALAPVTWPRAERPLPHSTTLTESFNTADSDTLGPDLSWAEDFGDVDVVSNKARPGALSTVGGARAESDVSSSDHYCKATCYLTGTGIKQNGPAARFSSSAVTCYWTRVNSDTPNNGLRLYKFVSGTQTQLGSSTTVSGTTYNGTLKTECNGSTIKAIDGTTDKVTATDTSITSGTRGGFRIYNGGSNLADVTFDAYEISDLAVASSDLLLRMMGQGLYASAGD